MTYQSLEKQVTHLGQMVQLLTSMVDDLGRNIDAIYKELDMLDGETELTGYDLCGCDKHYGHMCQDGPYTTIGAVRD
jgi:hypothetical protein